MNEILAIVVIAFFQEVIEDPESQRGETTSNPLFEFKTKCTDQLEDITSEAG